MRRGPHRPDLAARAARRTEAALAGHSGDTTTARRHLDDPDPEVRATALRALARLGELDPAALEVCFDDPSASLRRAVAELAGAGHGAADLVRRALDDSDPDVVEMGCWAAGERLPPAPEVSALLCSLAAGHTDALVREAAVAALGAIGDPSGLPIILDALRRDKATVRRRAVIALAPFEGPEVEAAIDRATLDRDSQVRAAAEDLRA